MMNKRLKQGSTFLLAVALTFPLLTLPGAKAASAINTGQKCSIEFDISGNSSELLSASIPVKLYKAVESYLWKKRKGISLQKTYPFFSFISESSYLKHYVQIPFLIPSSANRQIRQCQPG